ncbi:MAG: hypothetical protein EOP56_18605 [Sphingobacteriales bacterium]|nr:MAG: hypothetical protein EOP56_18605 [Sphingobacteriales bacterium]
MRILILRFLTACISCNTNASKETAESTIQVDSFLGSEYPGDDTMDLSGCARGAAVPVLKKSAFPQAVFQFGQDSFSATERTILKNGDSLMVIHTGCEYYVLTFRFVSAASVADSINAAYAYRKAISSMQSIYNNLDVATDVKLGTGKLAQYIKQHPQDLQLGEEIDFGGDDIRSYVTVDKAERTPGNRVAVEGSFLVGPL